MAALIIWHLIDNGCTHYMASDEGMFRELDTSFVSKARIRNGNFIEAKGRGKVVINTHSGNKTISNVLFVHDIDQNLLSVGQLIQKGYSLNFMNKSCMIKDSFGQKLVRIAMTDSCFILDVNQLDVKAYASLVDESCFWNKKVRACKLQIT